MVEIKLNEFAREVHQNAIAHGWWDEERSLAEIIALCHSELSEALEEYRAGRPMVWYPCTLRYGRPCNGKECHIWTTGACEMDATKEKPEGIAVEMADCIIRILDWCGKNGIDIESVLEEKHEYNKTRPYRHGGKKL